MFAFILIGIILTISWLAAFHPLLAHRNHGMIRQNLARVGLIGGRISDFQALHVATTGAGAAAIDPVNHVLRTRSPFGCETLVDLALVHDIRPGAANETFRFPLALRWRVAENQPEEELNLSFGSREMRDRFHSALAINVSDARLARRRVFPPREPSPAFATA